MKAIFPGSFDPFTTGHLDIAQRALQIFDILLIAVGYNENKPGMWSFQERTDAIRNLFAGNTCVEVMSYTGLTVDFARKNGCRAIVRGVRDAADFAFEQRLAETNRHLAGMETVLLSTRPELSYVSSSMVRELLHNGADASEFIAWKTSPLK